MSSKLPHPGSSLYLSGLVATILKALARIRVPRVSAHLQKLEVASVLLCSRKLLIQTAPMSNMSEISLALLKRSQAACERSRSSSRTPLGSQ